MCQRALTSSAIAVVMASTSALEGFVKPGDGAVVGGAAGGGHDGAASSAASASAAVLAAASEASCRAVTPGSRNALLRSL